MNFIHHHVAEVVQQITLGIEHVAQYFGGHNDHPGSGVDAGIPREQANIFCPVGFDQLSEFLVRQRLDGGGVEHFDLGGKHRHMNGKFGNNGFSSPGGSRNEHTATGFY